MARLGPRPQEWQTLCGVALMASLALAACVHQPKSAPGAQVTLIWEYAQPIPPIEGFLIERRTGTGPWQEVGRVEGTLYTFTDTTAPRNVPICYQVRVYRGQEQSPPSSEACLTIPATSSSQM